MNTSIAGHRDVRDGVIHTGAAALLLGAALAMNTAHAANDIERDDSLARPAQPAPPAMPARPAAAAEAQERTVRTAAERADLDERLRDAQERMNKAAAEVAAFAAERASEAMENMQFRGDVIASRGPVIGVDLDPKSTGGARVRDVSPGGPAEEAGLRAGDVIVMVDGKDVKDDAPGQATRNVVQQLQAFRSKMRKEPDAKITVQALRDGKPKDFKVAPRRITNAFAFAPPMIPNIDGVGAPPGAFNFNYKFFGGSSDLAGLEVTTLTPQLGRYFGTSKGVLVVRAPKSETYKLQDGDVIVSIDGREPTSGSHITRILSSYQAGEQVTLRVMRDHKTQDIQVTVPDRRQSRAGVATWPGEPM